MLPACTKKLAVTRWALCGTLLGWFVGGACPGGRLSFAQDLDRILRAMDEHRREELLRILPEAEARYPGHPTVLYLRGLLTEDADQAVTYYEQLLSKNPQSAYADDALYRICQYAFAKGLYASCELRCRQFLRDYPRSELRDRVEYLLASAFFARGERDSARAILQDWRRRFPNSPLRAAVETDLASFEERAARLGPEGRSGERPRATPSESETPGGQKSEVVDYTVQVGAFRDRANAQRQVRILKEAGYEGQIREKQVDGAVFYVVCVGTFRSVREAEEFGRDLNRRLGLPHRVVPLP
ncbi:MAG: SPOR domain-containing protein [candidate division KSB1 bacterium]|nr:SPOR domain-containing protein [candidate division KSB1 bacterium]